MDRFMNRTGVVWLNPRAGNRIDRILREQEIFEPCVAATQEGFVCLGPYFTVTLVHTDGEVEDTGINLGEWLQGFPPGPEQPTNRSARLRFERHADRVRGSSQSQLESHAHDFRFDFRGQSGILLRRHPAQWNYTAVPISTLTHTLGPYNENTLLHMTYFRQPLVFMGVITCVSRLSGDLLLAQPLFKGLSGYYYTCPLGSNDVVPYFRQWSEMFWLSRLLWDSFHRTSYIVGEVEHGCVFSALAAAVIREKAHAVSLTGSQRIVPRPPRFRGIRAFSSRWRTRCNTN
ncbi:putative 4-hydroxythreonine-4-phosphate2 dehydrogenase motif protein [Ranid herpesvirus 3]|uniref:Putative 4-hydroxythreonine-4-phosphate2 dehydrogenase motif protein n=1 Tax=Ranid herpesvirus 3 TaxID=1987509 RepID=A0A1X9T527_9VIRU|nr:putative 4-hydroxythreonine-4-phosphate2 dehydrogenase motif protein [Ranid herpesvirus 3]ARR28807.1 putative 4-hydroxythreonine-4-phosphate2 dehydrogenase motif protein [Ranid herpesvirus 3]